MSASGTENRRVSNGRWRRKNKRRTEGREIDDGNRGRRCSKPHRFRNCKPEAKSNLTESVCSRGTSDDSTTQALPLAQKPVLELPNQVFIHTLLWFILCTRNMEASLTNNRALALSVKKHYCWNHYLKSLKDSTVIGFCHATNLQWEGTSQTFFIIIYE